MQCFFGNLTISLRKLLRTGIVLELLLWKYTGAKPYNLPNYSRSGQLVQIKLEAATLSTQTKPIIILLHTSGKNVRGSGHKDSTHGNWNNSINKGNAGGGLAGGSGLGGGMNINRTNNGEYCKIYCEIFLVVLKNGR